MSVTYGASGFIHRTTGTSGTVQYPTGISAGDMLVLACYIFESGGANITSTGWTPIPNSPSPMSTSVQVHVFTREATGSESGSITVNADESLNGFVGHMMRFSKTLGAWDTISAGNGSESSSGWVLTTNQTIERVTGDMLVAFACGNGAAASLRSWSSETLDGVSADNRVNLAHTSVALQAHTSTATTNTTATSAVVHSATLNTNQAGNGIVMRLRDLSTHTAKRGWGGIPIKADS